MEGAAALPSLSETAALSKPVRLAAPFTDTRPAASAPVTVLPAEFQVNTSGCVPVRSSAVTVKDVQSERSRFSFVVLKEIALQERSPSATVKSPLIVQSPFSASASAPRIVVLVWLSVTSSRVMVEPLPVPIRARG